MDRLIFHVDVNSTFLSWEAARRVSLGEEDIRLIPSAIGGDREKRTGEPVAMALRKCPDLVLVRPDFRLYEASSKAFIEICKQYAPVVEQVSIDECFLDMSGTQRIYPDPIVIATTIKDQIRDELGFTVNVGIGDCKLLAKMASDFEKPDKVHTLFRHEIAKKMWPMRVGELYSVGHSSAEKLEKAKIKTIGDLANTEVARVQRFAQNISSSDCKEQGNRPPQGGRFPFKQDKSFTICTHWDNFHIPNPARKKYPGSTTAFRCSQAHHRRRRKHTRH